MKRVYDDPTPADGKRILVERLWPRGMTKSRAAVDLWLKDVAPSTERCASGSPTTLPSGSNSSSAYRKELKKNPQAVDRLRKLAAAGTVTLVYAARDEQHNAAVVLKELLEGAGCRTPVFNAQQFNAFRTRRPPRLRWRPQSGAPTAMDNAGEGTRTPTPFGTGS